MNKESSTGAAPAAEPNPANVLPALTVRILSDQPVDLPHDRPLVRVTFVAPDGLLEVDGLVPEDDMPALFQLLGEAGARFAAEI